MAKPAQNPSPEAVKAAKARAKEFKTFRKDYLFSQKYLAQTLDCGLRTVAAIESGREVIAPHYDLLRRFRDLKAKMQKAYGAPVPQFDRSQTFAAQREA
jgi:DNA-binding XRE family transcriptional regulator